MTTESCLKFTNGVSIPGQSSVAEFRSCAVRRFKRGIKFPDKGIAMERGKRESELAVCRVNSGCTFVSLPSGLSFPSVLCFPPFFLTSSPKREG